VGKLFKDDVGVEIQVDTKIDLTDVTTKKLLVQKADGTDVEWLDPTVSGTKLVYTTQASDLDCAGKYRLAAYVEFGATSKHTGETASFTVYNRFGGLNANA